MSKLEINEDDQSKRPEVSKLDEDQDMVLKKKEDLQKQIEAEIDRLKMINAGEREQTPHLAFIDQE